MNHLKFEEVETTSIGPPPANEDEGRDANRLQGKFRSFPYHRRNTVHSNYSTSSLTKSYQKKGQKKREEGKTKRALNVSFSKLLH